MSARARAQQKCGVPITAHKWPSADCARNLSRTCSLALTDSFASLKLSPLGGRSHATSRTNKQTSSRAGEQVAKKAPEWTGRAGPIVSPSLQCERAAGRPLLKAGAQSSAHPAGRRANKCARSVLAAARRLSSFPAAHLAAQTGCGGPERGRGEWR